MRQTCLAHNGPGAIARGRWPLWAAAATAVSAAALLSGPSSAAAQIAGGSYAGTTEQAQRVTVRVSRSRRIADIRVTRIQYTCPDGQSLGFTLGNRFPRVPIRRGRFAISGRFVVPNVSNGRASLTGRFSGRTVRGTLSASGTFPNGQTCRSGEVAFVARAPRPAAPPRAPRFTG